MADIRENSWKEVVIISLKKWEQMKEDLII
jgi:PHD/YefM family antitoxin component YafN of YafNO toxin-antitoxin module